MKVPRPGSRSATAASAPAAHVVLGDDPGRGQGARPGASAASAAQDLWGISGRKGTLTEEVVEAWCLVIYDDIETCQGAI
jgi:hypothetical protein